MDIDSPTHIPHCNGNIVLQNMLHMVRVIWDTLFETPKKTNTDRKKLINILKVIIFLPKILNNYSGDNGNQENCTHLHPKWENYCP